MNSSTSSENVFINSFSYLNQTSQAVISGNSTFANVINFPYRLGLSFIGAVNLQYEQTVKSEEIPPTLRSVFDTIGFFFSPYAIFCFVIAIVLNRFVVFYAVLNNGSRRTLPLWLSNVFHISAVVVLAMVSLGPLTLGKDFKILGDPAFAQEKFLLNIFYAFAYSYCVETIFTIMRNSSPLEGTDYSLFELSIQFYTMTNNNTKLLDSPDYIIDCSMAILSRILIHLVEIFRLRNYRLLFSTIMNLCHICYLGIRVKQGGWKSLPFSVKFRHFPKLFSVSIICLSLLIFKLSCLIRWDPFGKSRNSCELLQFYPLSRNWKKYLNYTGEEDFSAMATKFALLLCSGTELMEKGIRREFPAINIPDNVNEKFFISGYLNELSKPYKENTSISFPKKNSSILKQRFFLMFPKSIIWIMKKLVGQVFFGFRDNKDEDIPDNDPSKMLKITKTNSLNNSAGHKEDIELELLNTSDDEYSEDYEPSEVESLGDSDEENLEEDSLIFNETRDALLDLFSSEDNEVHTDYNWIMSTSRILQQKLLSDKTLTRASILDTKLSEVDEIFGTESDFDLSCAVCKVNERNTVLWPCRCFAICEDCRISLGLRGFSTCVCCRSKVHGYCKVHPVSDSK
ncbi:AFH_G0042060.mRNA.1.CDS.1 [Saccharomyces cerevisiae]|uniref:K7_Asi1p n=2 Tax=Saccharomyces cerevisiae TaxID=4932 RepID=G2WKG9_YEASK|nr:Asi1p [Saccharomyces cerevisiae YJM470]AJS79022.1 Asi1p [Saccharomyces cerevisiae YJM1208]AJS82505.1 Asi1p [Saccharomyces cerevisiae YJM1307]AJS89044.1 Asi1p [Saccharomyces cerevisiae YJM1388]AJS89483.1 Asi1p [Saccharomyces cerevisiae YJM1389]AJS96446.1 Asi1p [Saccharomyces cerevisiae YJM1460]AJS96880.1 Asi1p [Saccharomyces cerevisiae YJM1463]AJT00812.1 Asi1p [Saccharomyces cerevisiae YJM1592]AJT01252.1 Asi1p [Saccharomyces cerevisiae YJM1615]EEU05635.1 Asi1p [Saccharomyces cerevisiae J